MLLYVKLPKSWLSLAGFQLNIGSDLLQFRGSGRLTIFRVRLLCRATGLGSARIIATRKDLPRPGGICAARWSLAGRRSALCLAHPCVSATLSSTYITAEPTMFSVLVNRVSIARCPIPPGAAEYLHMAALAVTDKPAISFPE